jgi:4-carboxymuconolactone decarboxylase
MIASQERFAAGRQIRSDVVGAEYVERAFADADDFTREFQELVTEYCWGAGWGRESNGTLSRRDRSLLNLVMLGALNRSHELVLHLRGARRNGCTKEEIRDALFQLTIYAGVPAGVEAFRLAREVFAEEEQAAGA